MREILTLSGISHHFGDRRVLDGVSIALPRTGFTALVGPNGSGKSTLLRIAAGIFRPGEGEVSLWGKPLNAYGARDRAKLVSYLPQTIDGEIPFRVGELVRMGLYPYTSPPRLSPDDALAIVGLAGREDDPVSSLSGGERRRAYLAMTFVQDAGILLLDEPLAYLDVRYQMELVSLLKDLHMRRELSLLVALHDLATVFHFGKVYVLKEGRVAAEGDPRSVVSEEMIRDVFEVDARIYRHDDGTVTVGYGLP